MIFEDLIEEGFKDDLDKKIDAQKRRSQDWRSHYAKNRSYQPSPQEHVKFRKPSIYTNSRWIIKDKVMRACRPGYPGSMLNEDVIGPWLNDVIKNVGEKPKSIITFLTDSELEKFYNFDLIQKYKDMGFEVRRLPKHDPIYSAKKDPVFDIKDVQQVKEWIKELPKPVLIHCSAGIDRTGEMESYLLMAQYGAKNKISVAPKNKSQSIIKKREKDEDGTERIYLHSGAVWQREANSAKWERIEAPEEKPKGDPIKRFYDKWGKDYKSSRQ